MARVLTPPSSESLTRAAIYEAQPEALFVFHVHIPDLWIKETILELPETAAEMPCGTVDMALGLKASAADAGEKGLSSMTGDENVISFWSKSAISAGLLLMNGLEGLRILR